MRSVAAEPHPLGGETSKPKKSGWLWILALIVLAGGAYYYYKIAPFLREQGRARARRQGSFIGSCLGGRHVGSEAKRALLSFGAWDGDARLTR